jgi:hypothetical protein
MAAQRTALDDVVVSDERTRLALQGATERIL